MSSRGDDDWARSAARLCKEILEEPEARPVLQDTSYEQIARELAGTIGEEGIGVTSALEEFRDRILPKQLNVNHPMYFGHTTTPLPAAVAADVLVSSLNSNAAIFRAGRAFCVAEQEVLRSFASLFGLPPHADAMTLAGGTYANLEGLLLARVRAFGSDLPTGARLYLSDSGHFSVHRAARVLGLPPDALVEIPSRGRGSMDAEKLRETISSDLAAGRRPFAVVATLGTTATGALDPLREIAELCARHDLWFHVDACYGGASALLANPPWDREVVARADSIAVDPHKWMLIPIASSVLLHSHPELALRLYGDEHAPYTFPRVRAEPWQRGLSVSRRATGFVLWFALRAHGWTAIRTSVERHVALARRFEERMRENGAMVLPDGQLSLACARVAPPGMTADDDIDRLQHAIARKLEIDGTAWITTAGHGGRIWLRPNMINLHTREAHVDRLVELVFQAARNASN